MNEELRQTIETMARRAEEIKVNGKLHNVLYDMSSDIVLLVRLLTNALEENERLRSEPKYGRGNDAC